jgi:hypothetical protein
MMNGGVERLRQQEVQLLVLLLLRTIHSLLAVMMLCWCALTDSLKRNEEKGGGEGKQGGDPYCSSVSDTKTIHRQTLKNH